MPIYEYFCTPCNTGYEVIREFDDKPILKCPKCGKNLNKLVSKCTFRLAGGGWYAEDYKPKKKEEDSK